MQKAASQKSNAVPRYILNFGLKETDEEKPSRKVDKTVSTDRSSASLKIKISRVLLSVHKI